MAKSERHLVDTLAGVLPGALQGLLAPERAHISRRDHDAQTTLVVTADLEAAQSLEPFVSKMEKAAARSLGQPVRLVLSVEGASGSAAGAATGESGAGQAAAGPGAQKPQGAGEAGAHARSERGESGGPLRLAERVIMVASGKGGVGKSTVAVNVAVALSRQGRRVGLLDADVYGPSAPTLLGCPQARPDADAEGKPIAIEAHGIHALSTGFLTDDDRAFALRGPMATRALARIGEMGGWPEALDVLIVDAPPGTGDIHLSMVQRLSVDGAVVVSTPNTLALADVRRAISFLHAARIPVLGLVENMSVVEDPKTGARVDIYGEGGLNRLAQAAGVPVLAAIPQTPDLRLSCDSGVPAAANAQTYEAQHFELLADQIVEAVSRPGATATPPRIVVEDAA